MSQAAEIINQPTLAGLSASKRTILLDETTGRPIAIFHPGPPAPCPTVHVYAEDGSRVTINRSDIGEWTQRGYSVEKPKSVIDAETMAAGEAAELAEMKRKAEADAIAAYKKLKAERAGAGAKKT